MPYYLALESSGAEARLIAGLFDIVDDKWQSLRFNSFRLKRFDSILHA
jgi:hypothetical protein